MTWWASGMLANLCIMIVESVNRSNTYGSFAGTIPYTITFILLAQWGLYHSWSTAPTMMMAWAFFTCGNSAMRLVSNQYVVREPLDWRQVVLVGMMVGCAFLIKQCK